MQNEQEIWQIDVKGQIYETNFDELKQWISEGAVVRDDKVRRGNLRWLEAGRIPGLITFFNAKDLNIQPEIVPTTNYHQDAADQESGEIEFEPVDITPEVQDPEPGKPPLYSEDPHHQIDPNACVVHQDSEPVYVCDACLSLLCGACPKKYGGTVRTCPMCGSLCKKIEEVESKQQDQRQFKDDISGGFGFVDFSNAIGYPFGFKVSLMAGGFMFALFSLGQRASAIGGILMFCAAIFCLMLANMLTFGVLANTVENFSQGKLGGNFMPSFDDFELWNDVIQPFFLSIGVYLVSFGLLAAVIIGGAWYAASSVTESLKQQSTAILTPGQRSDLDAAKRVAKVKGVTEGLAEDNLYADGEIPDEAAIVDKQALIDQEEAEFQGLQNMIVEHRKGQVESFTGPDTATQQAAYNEMINSFISFAFPFLILAMIALAWGIFYFPAACLVAGYTRSFSATLNPMIGLDTIKRLGLDYFKILFMGFLLFLFLGITSLIIASLLSPFDMPMMGNLPAIFFSGFITFYVSVVFSVLLGFAMYKNSDKFKLFQR